MEIPRLRPKGSSMRGVVAVTLADSHEVLLADFREAYLTLPLGYK